VIVHVPLFSAFAPILPALVLVPFLVLKANRRVQAWAVLIPFLLVFAAAIAVRAVPSRGLDRLAAPLAQASPFVVGLACSLSVLLLMAHAIPAWSRRVRRFAVPAFAVLPATLALGIDQAPGGLQNLPGTLLFGAALLLLLGVITISGKRTRRKWEFGRFCLWFLLGSIIVALLATWIVIGYMMISQPSSRPPLYALLLVSTLFPLLIAVVLFVPVLPFMLLAFTNPLHRERVMAVFRAAPEASAPPPATAALPSSS
jgi:hypothetical protein